MRIGDRLAELRKQNQYTQKELAQKLNVSQQIMSEGKLSRIFTFCEVQPIYIIFHWIN